MGERIVRNAAKCLKCRDVVESKHHHDFQSCSCGDMFVDGGKEYVRIGAKDFDDVELLTEREECPHDGLTYSRSWDGSDDTVCGDCGDSLDG